MRQTTLTTTDYTTHKRERERECIDLTLNKTETGWKLLIQMDLYIIYTCTHQLENIHKGRGGEEGGLRGWKRKKGKERGKKWYPLRQRKGNDYGRVRVRERNRKRKRNCIP